MCKQNRHYTFNLTLSFKHVILTFHIFNSNICKIFEADCPITVVDSYVAKGRIGDVGTDELKLHRNMFVINYNFLDLKYNNNIETLIC